VHVHRVDVKVICSHTETVEHLSQGLFSSLVLKHDIIRVLPELGLDEAEEVFLRHAGAVVDVSIDTARVVHVTVRSGLCLQLFSPAVQLAMEAVPGFQQLQSTVSK